MIHIPPLVPVTSSNLLAVGYDAPSETLFVAFKGGTVYAYLAVPATVHEELMAAPSKGSYLARGIKNHYRYVKLDVTVAPLSEAA